MKAKAQSRSGLSLRETVFVLATIAFVFAVLLPMVALTQGNRRSPRIHCTSSLKQVGLAYRLWSNDHDDQFPFASTNATSSLAFANSPQVFRHYTIMSNELVTPKVLVCATDAKRVRATSFANLSNRNISYFVGLDADESKPERILSGDRNVAGGTLSNGFMRVLTPTGGAGWSAEIHVNAGNIGLADGSSQQATSAKLDQQLRLQTLPLIRLAIP